MKKNLSLLTCTLLLLTQTCWAYDMRTLENPDISKFKNPFKTYLPEKEEIPSPAKIDELKKVEEEKKKQAAKKEKTSVPSKVKEQVKIEPPKPTIIAPKLEISGIVWNTERPQAIINGKVVAIGDKVSDSEIIAIDKTGVEILYQGQKFNISYN